MPEVTLKPCPMCGGIATLDEGPDNYLVICCSNKKCICGRVLLNKQDAIESWNRRAPEPGTRVVRWTRYDGTPETRPPELTRMLVYEPTNWMHIEKFVEGNPPRVGSFWAPLPEPPEGMG